MKSDYEQDWADLFMSPEEVEHAAYLRARSKRSHKEIRIAKENLARSEDAKSYYEMLQSLAEDLP